MRVHILSAQFVIVEVTQNHCGHHKESLWRTHKINVRSHKVFVGHKKIIVKAQKLIKRPCSVIVRKHYSFWRSQRVIVKVTWSHCQGTQVIVKVHRHCEGIQCEGHIESLGEHWGFVRRQRFTMRAYKLLHKATVQQSRVTVRVHGHCEGHSESLWHTEVTVKGTQIPWERHTESLFEGTRSSWRHTSHCEAMQSHCESLPSLYRAHSHCEGHTWWLWRYRVIVMTYKITMRVTQSHY